MKIFLYKFLIVLIGFFLLFELTIGSKIKSYERNFKYMISQQNMETIKEKLRDEIKSGLNKKNYLDREDAELISQFLKKIQKELNTSDTE